MANKYNFNLKHIFKNETEFKNAVAEVRKSFSKIREYKEKLNNAQNIYECFALVEKQIEEFGKIEAYALCLYYADTRSEKNIKRYRMVLTLEAEITENKSFIRSEIFKLTEEEINHFYLEDIRLEDFRITISDMLKVKEHELSEKEESILSMFLDTFDDSKEIHNALITNGFEYPYIFTKDDDIMEFTSKMLEDKDVYIRKQAFYALYSGYVKEAAVFAETYLRHVKTRAKIAKLRKYNSALEKKMIEDGSTVSIYNNLLKNVAKHADSKERFTNYMKEALKLEEIHSYDMFLNIGENSNFKLGYEDAKVILRMALSVLGKEYCGYVAKAYKEEWIDVYERVGKMPGAYSISVYGIHSYIVLDYNNTFDSLFALAHEVGHIMNFELTNSNQTYNNSKLESVFSEVPSLVNEILLAEYLLKNLNNDKIKSYILNIILNKLNISILEQAIFAEFEQIIHAKIEKGIELSSEEANNIYLDIYKKYMPGEVCDDNIMKYDWERSMLLFEEFHIYKYVVGTVAAITIVQNILSGKKEYVEKYINILKAGKTITPLEKLKMLGVNLNSKKTVDVAFQYYDQKLESLKELNK